jgi:hypothetical protein
MQKFHIPSLKHKTAKRIKNAHQLIHISNAYGKPPPCTSPQKTSTTQPLTMVNPRFPPAQKCPKNLKRQHIQANSTHIPKIYFTKTPSSAISHPASVNNQPSLLPKKTPASTRSRRFSALLKGK